MTEKILILGGNKAQVPLIEASKREGYHVVLCDYTSTNPGIALSDTHYQENFMNREEVLRIAEKEHVNGVISNSEAAMPIVAYVSEKMNLTGNTLAAVTNITSKKAFRDLQHRLKLFAPECVITSSFEEALTKSEGLKFPVIMKPDKSSGSRGTTRIDSYSDMKNQYDNWKVCSDFSLNSNVVIEGFIDMPSLDYILDGDVFVHEDIFIWDGLFTSKRSKLAPTIPMTQTYPAVLSESELEEVKRTFESIFRGAGIKFGEFNVEMYYTKEHELFVIEINARQGGNNIPRIIEKHCGIDMYRLLVTTAMGHDYYLSKITPPPSRYKYVSKHLVFTHTSGKYQGLFISPEIAPYVTEIIRTKDTGIMLQPASSAVDKLAEVDLEFPARDLQLKYVNMIEEMIYPVMEA